MTVKAVLAEDESDIQLVARLALQRVGFVVRAVSNGRQVIEAVRAELPDVILLDWMMPELDGPATCRQLKADPATADVPVIFLTAKSQESEIQVGLALGAVGYITKPFDVLTLGRRVRELIRKPQSD